MDVIDIISLYNPKVSLDKESVFMVPIGYLEEVRKLAEKYNAKLQIYQKRRGKYVYIKWTPVGAVEKREELMEDDIDEQCEVEEGTQ